MIIGTEEERYLDVRVGDVWDIEGTAWRCIVLVLTPLDRDGRANCFTIRFWNDDNDETWRCPPKHDVAFVTGRKRSTLVARVE